jgi:hypothetical protein
MICYRRFTKRKKESKEVTKIKIKIKMIQFVGNTPMPANWV